MAEIATLPIQPAKKPVRFRRLKIAWTVFFAVLTVALCVLWVRSYWVGDGYNVRINKCWILCGYLRRLRLLFLF